MNRTTSRLVLATTALCSACSGEAEPGDVQDLGKIAKVSAPLTVQAPPGITHVSAFPEPPLLESRRDGWLLHMETNFFNETGASITFQTGEFVAHRSGLEVRRETIDPQTFNMWHNEYPANGGIKVPASLTIDDGSRVVFFNPFVEFPDGEEPDTVSFSFQFSGLSSPVVLSQIAVQRVDQNPSIYGLPFKQTVLGSWAVGGGHDLGHDGNTPAGHRFAIGFPEENPLSIEISQRYADDFAVFDQNFSGLSFGDGTQNQHYLAWNQDIVAIGAGKVVDAKNTVPDNVPGVIGADAGNFVAIDHLNGEISVYAHFRQGTVTVVKDQFVQKGQFLGKCGNSGASSGPHLHFELNKPKQGPQGPVNGGDGLPTYHENAGFHGKNRAFTSLPQGEPVAALLPGTLLTADFERSTDGFTFDSPNGIYAEGTMPQAGGFQSPGAARLRLGGLDNALVSNLVASWDNTFFVAHASEHRLTVRYNLTQSPNYESNETSQFTVHVLGPVSMSLQVASVTGNGNGGPDISTGWQLLQQDLGHLPAGRYVIALEVFNNQKNAANEQTTLLLDNALVTSFGCSEALAVDMGLDGNSVTVPNNGCVRVRDAYPVWWTVRTMKLETTANGSYPVPFVWSNTCSGSAGSATFTANWQARFLPNINADCATVIDLQGSGSGNVTLRYWAQ